MSQQYAARRSTWEVIRRNRAGRAIVLTTHSMEEADLLADRIAIMAAGRLVAEGTPLDLKARYGVGYTLTIVKQRAPESDRCGATNTVPCTLNTLEALFILAKPLPPLGEGLRHLPYTSKVAWFRKRVLGCHCACILMFEPAILIVCIVFNGIKYDLGESRGVKPKSPSSSARG